MNVLDFINPAELLKHVIRWFSRPRPEVCFEYSLSVDPENNYCHLRYNNSAGKDSWFFRIGVNNRGRERIEECDVRVEKIQRVENGTSINIVSSPFFLHWSNENTDNSRSVYPNSEVFCDVVFTVKESNKLFIHHKRKHSGAGVPSWLKSGRYIFFIKVLGANISSVEKQIRIDFDGQWDNLMMELE